MSIAPVPLLLRRAQGHRPGGNWDKDDFDVVDGQRVVGRIFLDANGAWFWVVSFIRKSYGTADSRDAALAAFKAEYEYWLNEAAAALRVNKSAG